MDINQLRYFLAVAKYENITRAAEALFITQPSLSRSIARLEEEIGVPLFERDRRKLKLNKSGEVLQEAVKKAFLELEQGVAAAQECRMTDLAIITIAYSIMINYASISAQAIMKMEDVVLSEITCQSSDIPSLLRSKKAHLAVSFDTLLDPDLERIKLAEYEVRLLASAQGRYAGKQSIALKDLKNASFVCNESGFNRQLTEALCMQAGFVPKIKFISANYEAIGYLIETYDVVSFIPDNNPKDAFTPRASMIPFHDGPYKVPLNLYFLRDSYIDPPLENIILGFRKSFDPQSDGIL